MDSREGIIKQQQIIARLEQSEAIIKLKKRKAETRRKIEFGGLVVKAQMDNFSKEAILGALLHAKQNIQNDKVDLDLFESIGKAAFSKKD